MDVDYSFGLCQAFREACKEKNIVEMAYIGGRMSQLIKDECDSTGGSKIMESIPSWENVKGDVG